MNTKEILKKVRKIEIKTKRLSDHIFSGEYHSSFKGRGMTFSEVRKYQFGDDVRSIDWNVTAKLNEPYVKVFEEERELTMMLMVDVSGSELFGSDRYFKRDILTEICATLAFSAMQNNDKIGMILFTDEIELFIPPSKGRMHVLRIIRELVEFQPKSNKTNIDHAFRFLANVMKKKAIAFVLSDFMDDSYADSLKIIARKHDVTGIRIYDKYEMDIPDVGVVQMMDRESGQAAWVNTSSQKVRQAFKAQHLKYAHFFEESFVRSGAGTISMRIDESYAKKLLGYFKRKGA